MLYPPILTSTQPVFLANTENYRVYFTLSSFVSADDAKVIGILVAQQSNNKSIVDTSKWPDAVIYQNWDGKNNYVDISKAALSPQWVSGGLYKIQLRFGSEAYNSSEDFASWHKRQINENHFSEWSTVMIVKAIDDPELQLTTDINSFVPSEGTSIDLVSSLTPTFFGMTTFTKESKEVETQYRISISEGSSVIASTGWLLHVGAAGSQDLGYFNTVLENRHTYKAQYEIKSNNGYYKQLDSKSFIAIESTVGDITNIDIHASIDQDNGAVNISLVSIDSTPILGNYIIVRTSSESNYRRLEDIRFLNFVNEDLSAEKVYYTDYTVESGITYKYALQGFNSKEIRTNAKYTAPIMVDLQEAYLYRDGVQLALKFNQKMNSFKHTTLRSKQDTIGDKYPHLFQNGSAYYAEFPITGLISFQENTSAFFTIGSDGMYYKGELIIPSSKFETIPAIVQRSTSGEVDSANLAFNHKISYDWDEATQKSGYAKLDDLIASSSRRGSDPIGTTEEQSQQTISSSITTIPSYTISTNLTDNNIYIERKFREKVEEFLNDFNCKLYRSPTEGNIAVNLMNVSLTPEESLGRMIFSFTATAYEVIEASISELNKYGVINIGSKNVFSEDEGEEYKNFGQIIYWPGHSDNEIYNKETSTGLIREQQEVSIGIYKFHVTSVDQLWIEKGSKDMILTEIAKQLDEKDTADSYLWEALASSATQITQLNINSSNNTFIIPPDKIYTTPEDEEITYLQGVNSSSKWPIIINYFCSGKLIYDSNPQEVTSIILYSDFGQVRGIFSNDSEELRRYNSQYDSSETLAIADIPKGKVYKTLDIDAVVKESIKEQIEKDKTITLTELEDGTWLGSDSKEYRFGGFESFDIEAPAKTAVKISDSVESNTYIIDSRGSLDLTHIYFANALNYADSVEFVSALLPPATILTVAPVSINYSYYLEVRAISQG